MPYDHLCQRTRFGAVARLFLCAVLASAAAGNAAQDAPVPIEQFGAVAFYSEDKFCGSLTITPLTAEGKSLLTYTGADAPFDVSWAAKRVEFVGLRCHKNPIQYPPAGVVNGNYFPGMVSCRYSRVVEVVDGKNLKVDFVYNGGSIEHPQATPNAYGYFFIDCRGAFARAFSADVPATRISLQDGRTYVCKGGWNTKVAKNIHLSAAKKAAIKLSLEDAFLMDEDPCLDPNALGGQDRASYAATYVSGALFVLEDNTRFDVRLENIDLLPPHYTAPCSGSNAGGCGALFAHSSASDYGTNLQGRWICGKRELVNCDNQTEARRYAGVKFPSQPWFFGGPLCISNDGGKLNAAGTDIAEYQEFNFFDVEWFGNEPMGLRSVSRAGNIFRMINTRRKRLSAGNAMTNVDRYSATVRFKDDLLNGKDRGRRAIEITDGRASAYQLASTVYWSQWGHLAHSDGDARRSGRISFKEPARNCDWYLTFPTPGMFVRDYPETEPLNARNFAARCRPCIDAVTLRTFEKVPVSDSARARRWGLQQTVITVDGKLNRKLSNTQFVFEEYAFQARVSYPFLIGKGEMRGDAANDAYLENYPDCDELEYADPDDGNKVKTVRIIKRYRHSRSQANARFVAIPYWVYEFDAPVAATTPTFRVKRSVLEFALDPAGVACDFRVYRNGTSPRGVQWQYLCYTSKSLNWDMRNVDVYGYIRASDHDQPARTAADPLWTMSAVKSWKACKIDGDSAELWGQRTLKARREKTGDPKYMALVDNADLGAGAGNMRSPSGKIEIPED